LPDLAYVNGWVGPLRQARVAVLDRGFLFADGVYEVLRTYGGRPFALQAHLRRLQHSRRGLRLPAPLPNRRLRALILELLQRSGYDAARIYIQVTRGSSRRRQHLFPRSVQPTLVIYVEKSGDEAGHLQAHGASVRTLPDWRWKFCHLKTLVLLPNVMARQAAWRAGADEAVLLGPGGVVREGATSNIFVLRRGVLRTHPLGPEILPGVSRQVTLELARAQGLEVREQPFRRAALFAADEVLLSSTSLEVTPVVRVDGKRIGSGAPGPVAQALLARFHARTRGKPWRRRVPS